jgi:hypothetical protein
MVVMFFSVGTFAQLDQFSLPFEHERIYFPGTTICGIQTSRATQMHFVNGQKPVNRDFDKLSYLYQELYLPITVKKQGKWGGINRHGDIIFPFQYDNASGFQMSPKHRFGQ